MSITELEMFYETALRPVFGSLLRIVHERDDFAHVILDGEREKRRKDGKMPQKGRFPSFWC